MLYNESTGKPKIQAEVFSLEGIGDWLQTKPADGAYEYADIHNCLLAQYCRSRGYRVLSVGPTNVTYLRFLPFRSEGQSQLDSTASP